MAAALLAFAFLAGITHSGARYFYCEAMGLSPSDPCIGTALGSHDGKDPTAAFRPLHIDCCEIVTLPAMPDAARVESPYVPQAAVLAVVAPVRCADPILTTDRARERSFERWRIPPRPSNQLRAQLMVFLT